MVQVESHCLGVSAQPERPLFKFASMEVGPRRHALLRVYHRVKLRPFWF